MKLIELNIFVIHKTPQIAVCNILTCCCRAPEQQNLLVTSGVLEVRAFAAEIYVSLVKVGRGLKKSLFPYIHFDKIFQF